MIVSEDTLQGGARVHSNHWHFTLATLWVISAFRELHLLADSFVRYTVRRKSREEQVQERAERRRRQDHSEAVLFGANGLLWLGICFVADLLTARQALGTSGSQQKRKWIIQVFRQSSSRSWPQWKTDSGRSMYPTLRKTQSMSQCRKPMTRER